MHVRPLILPQELKNKCEQNVADHAQYQKNLSQAQQWLQAAHAQLGDIDSVAGSKDELEEQKGNIAKLLANKEEAHGILSAVLEMGEKLYTSTAPEGREKIRQVELQAVDRILWSLLCKTVFHLLF